MQLLSPLSLWWRKDCNSGGQPPCGLLRLNSCHRRQLLRHRSESFSMGYHVMPPQCRCPVTALARLHSRSPLARVPLRSVPAARRRFRCSEALWRLISLSALRDAFTLKMSQLCRDPETAHWSSKDSPSYQYYKLCVLQRTGSRRYRHPRSLLYAHSSSDCRVPYSSGVSATISEYTWFGPTNRKS